MNGVIAATARLVFAAKRSYEQKWLFCVVFVLVFATCVAILNFFDLLPESPSSAVAAAPLAESAAPAAVVLATLELPVRVSIPSIGVDAPVANPESISIDVLDKLLLAGAVRYPTSAELNEAGNVVLFGHSSYLPIVLNKAYKSFNGIQKLAKGDTITVYSADTAYTYTVQTMERENTASASVPLEVTGRVLTLTTCDSFGAKSDRFVVTADFVESHSISS